jgi:X-X-X-Leu-X-X-Gly heptad repeat protein
MAGQANSGVGKLAQGIGAVSGSGGEGAWTPSVLYLFLLIFAEMIAFAFLGRVLR